MEIVLEHFCIFVKLENATACLQTHVENDCCNTALSVERAKQPSSNQVKLFLKLKSNKISKT
jgi:hypothetical protein